MRKSCHYHNPDWESEFKRHIHKIRSRAKSSQTLDLSGLGMNWGYASDMYAKELAPWFHVEKIDLSRNYIDSIIIDLSNFHQLKELNLACNSLSYWGLTAQFRFKSQIRSSTLEHLNLSNCDVCHVLMNGVLFAETLQTLDLSGNSFSRFRTSGRLYPVLRMARFPNLTKLWLCDNDYPFAPKLNYLPKLSFLDLSNNPIARNCGELARMPSLKELCLRGTGMKSIPKPLLGMGQLEHLDLRMNDLPENSLELLQKHLPHTKVLI